MKNMLRVVFVAVMVCLTALSFGGCEKKGKRAEGPIEDHFSIEKDYEGENPVAKIEVSGYGNIYIELYPDVAPNTVNNFISLANSGFYDGVVFHRVIENFMIQTGDPEGTGMGGPGYTIPGEFSDNGFKNELAHKRGVISMARMGMDYNGVKAYDSAGSQFFIVHKDSPSLNRQYAAFGQVISGMDVVDAIAESETDSNDRPVKDIVMEKVLVETFGKTYEEPIKA